ncbi:hypothetical protein AVEN_77064-1 [Araneus ventricosus]|uniref:Uncharacterized protein n=1 Tax=Araneus ventricosus TaxID=182803 RepID=A0A4Y2G6W7_ARAVE|nr:hypothetical protein AVEN_77064-1 [Araneus ventricosus]
MKLVILKGGQMARATPKLTSLFKLPHHTSGWSFVCTYVLTYNSPTYTEVLQWNQVLNMETFGPEAEILLLDHNGLQYSWKEKVKIKITEEIISAKEL